MSDISSGSTSAERTGVNGAEVGHVRPRQRTGLDRLSAPGTGRSEDARTGSATSVEESIPKGEPTRAGADRWPVAALPAWLEPSAVDPSRRCRVTDSGPSDTGVPDVDDGIDELFDDDPTDTTRRRFAVAPPAAIAIILVGVVACAVAGYGLFRGSDEAPLVDFPAAGVSASADVTPRVDPSIPGSGQPTGSAPTPAAAEVVVSVVGLVNKPGLVRLTTNSRVADALQAAGGTRDGADTVSLNLAQVVRDGDQILVGYAGDEGLSLRSAVVAAAGGSTAAASPRPNSTETGATGSGGSSSGTSGALTNLNTATEAELDALPGIGPVTAKAIIDWRTRNGTFNSVDQLGEVDGIGPARLAKLRTLVTV